MSDAYCLRGHGDLPGGAAAHSHHRPGTPGAFRYDGHMPHSIRNLVGGYERWTRTHRMSSIPDPAATIRHGPAGAPNACNDCHADRSAEWALEWCETWWGDG